jgi:hypothetical protein
MAVVSILEFLIAIYAVQQCKWNTLLFSFITMPLCYFYTSPSLVIYFNLKIQVFCNVTQRHIPKDINHLTKPLSEPQVSRDINLPFYCISPLNNPHFPLLSFPTYPSQIYPLDISISLYFSLYHISLFSILLSSPFLSQRFFVTSSFVVV